jgi:hypothetical protein
MYQAGQSLSDALSEFAKKKDILDVERLLDEYGVTDRAMRRKIHDQITKQHLTLEGIEEIIEEEVRLSKKEPPLPPPIEPNEENWDEDVPN